MGNLMLNRLKLNKSNLLEWYILAQISVGLPTIGFIFAGWKAALTVLILAHISFGLLALRKGEA